MARPVWFSTVRAKSCNTSGKAMAAPSVLDLMAFKYCPVSGGISVSNACGSTTSRIVRPCDRPKERAASV